VVEPADVRAAEHLPVGSNSVFGLTKPMERMLRPGAKSPGGGARIGRGRPGPLGGPGAGRPMCVGTAGATGAAVTVGEAGAAEASVVAGGAGAEDFFAKPFRPHSDAINKESADVLHQHKEQRAEPEGSDYRDLPRPGLAAESCWTLALTNSSTVLLV